MQFFILATLLVLVFNPTFSYGKDSYLAIVTNDFQDRSFPIKEAISYL